LLLRGILRLAGKLRLRRRLLREPENLRGRRRATEREAK
jgi:hypothetical protein